MQGRRFVDLARENLAGGTEVHRRGAIGRAYYAIFLEARDALVRWGFKAPAGAAIHAFVRLRFTYAADADLKSIGLVLDKLIQLRTKADYDLSTLAIFASDHVANNAIQEAADKIVILDAIEADAARRTAVIAAIKKAFP